MRGRASGTAETRGASPQLTIAKHKLRDWVESRLAALKSRDDEAAFAGALNSELRNAGLICGQEPGRPCPDWTSLGFLEKLTLHRSGGFLIIQTSLGIECGFDESAYIFSWSENRWRRVWQNEQNDYQEGKYKPQILTDVLISRFNPSNDYLVLTLGFQSWCSSNWREAYYRVFRPGPDPDAAPLVDDAELAFDPSNIRGVIRNNEALVEFTVGSIDGGVHSRETIRHYAIDGSEVTRIQPYALKPRDFVEEWLTREWKEVYSWSDQDNLRQMSEWHDEKTRGEFIYPTLHCQQSPDLWQVGLNLDGTPADSAKPKQAWFLVRWQPPYRFTMMNVSSHPSPSCTEEDRFADEQPQSLFPDKYDR